jgi:hypothetical protein
MGDFIEQGRWVEGFKAQDKMLDEHMKKYNLEKMDWRWKANKVMPRRRIAFLLSAYERKAGLTGLSFLFTGAIVIKSKLFFN